MRNIVFFILILCIQSANLHAESLEAAYEKIIFKLQGPVNADYNKMEPLYPVDSYLLEVEDKNPLSYPKTIWIYGANNKASKLEFAKEGKRYETYTGEIENEKYVSIVYTLSEGEAFHPFMASEINNEDLLGRIYFPTYLYSSSRLVNDTALKIRIEKVLSESKSFPFKINSVTNKSDCESVNIISFQKGDVTLLNYTASCTDWRDGHVEGKTYSALLQPEKDSYKFIWESSLNHETIDGLLMADIDDDSNPETIISSWAGEGLEQLAEIENNKLTVLKTLRVSGD